MVAGQETIFLEDSHVRVKMIAMDMIPEYPRQRMSRRMAGRTERKLWEDSSSQNKSDLLVLSNF